MTNQIDKPALENQHALVKPCEAERREKLVLGLISRIESANWDEDLERAVLYARHLVGQRGVPETWVNSGCYFWFNNLFKRESDYAILVAKVFKSFRWGYWLPEQYWEDVFEKKVETRIVSNNQSPKVYKDKMGE